MAIRLDGCQEFFVGDNKPLVIRVWDQEVSGTNLSSATVTVTLYDYAGSTVSAGTGTMTTSGTDLLVCKKNWAPSTETPGRYRAVATVVYSGNTYQFEWPVLLLPKPSAL